jgi:hypothetical protein
MYGVWDNVNERFTRDKDSPFPNGKTDRFADPNEAQGYATQLNQFGGYGGWVDTRFTVKPLS